MCHKCDERDKKTQRLAKNLSRAAIASVLGKKMGEIKDGEHYELTNDQTSFLLSALSGAFVGTGKMLGVDGASMLFGSLMQISESYPEVKRMAANSINEVMREEEGPGVGFLSEKKTVH